MNKYQERKEKRYAKNGGVASSKYAKKKALREQGKLSPNSPLKVGAPPPKMPYVLNDAGEYVNRITGQPWTGFINKTQDQ